MTNENGAPERTETQHNQDRSERTPEPFFSEWRRRWRDPITFFTFLLVVVGGLQWAILRKTDETLRLQQRAWISFVGAIPFDKPKKEEGIGFRLLYLNSGREPAIGVNIATRNYVIDSYDPKFANLYDIAVPKNTSCENLSADPGKAVFWPTSLATVGVFNQNSIHGSPRYVADDKVVAGEKFYVVEGCAAYSTQEETRYASFCYILESSISPPVPVSLPFPFQNIPALQAGQLPTANQGASSQGTENRVFTFVTCARGFDTT
jgi:hypothetical protein